MGFGMSFGEAMQKRYRLAKENQDIARMNAETARIAALRPRDSDNSAVESAIPSAPAMTEHQRMNAAYARNIAPKFAFAGAPAIGGAPLGRQTSMLETSGFVGQPNYMSFADLVTYDPTKSLYNPTAGFAINRVIGYEDGGRVNPRPSAYSSDPQYQKPASAGKPAVPGRAGLIAERFGGMLGQARDAITGRQAQLRQQEQQILGYAMGGEVTPVPDISAHPLYKQYLIALHRAGMLDRAEPPQVVIPKLAQYAAQERLKLAQQANMGGTQGYARGGEVDVGGKLVVGPGSPKSDSIPATIDGMHKAALSTGEFVFPRKAVEFYGTKVLDAMVEKARQALRKQAITQV